MSVLGRERPTSQSHHLTISPLLLALLLVATPAQACMLDDVDGAISRDTLNHYFPEALTVLARAVETRRAKGDPPAPGLTPTPVHIQRQMTALSRLNRQLRAAASESRTGPFALLLLESMLWARFPALPGMAPPDLHAKGPGDGDLVMVTSEDALARVVAGEMTLADAAAQGWLRLYGTEAQRDEFMQAFAHTGRIPASAITRAPTR